MDGSQRTHNVSQELHVSVVKEKVQVAGSNFSSYFSPSTASTKRVNPFSIVGEIVDADSDEEEVVNTFDESMNLFGGGHDCKDNYDDYAMQVYNLLGNFDAFFYIGRK